MPVGIRSWAWPGSGSPTSRRRPPQAFRVARGSAGQGQAHRLPQPAGGVVRTVRGVGQPGEVLLCGDLAGGRQPVACRRVKHAWPPVAAGDVATRGGEGRGGSVEVGDVAGLRRRGMWPPYGGRGKTCGGPMAGPAPCGGTGEMQGRTGRRVRHLRAWMMTDRPRRTGQLGSRPRRARRMRRARDATPPRMTSTALRASTTAIARVRTAYRCRTWSASARWRPGHDLPQPASA
jgi:hypothetical protein